MKIHNMQKMYAKIISCYRCDPYAPFSDGSIRDIHNNVYICEMNETYEFLKEYIGTDKLLEVVRIDFADDCQILTGRLWKHKVSVFNEKRDKIYTFCIGEPNDGTEFVDDMYDIELIMK